MVVHDPGADRAPAVGHVLGEGRALAAAGGGAVGEASYQDHYASAADRSAMVRLLGDPWGGRCGRSEAADVMACWRASAH